MFCPKCASQNIDGASFCRVCGANISLVPQALTGQLPEARPTEGDLDWVRSRRRRRNRQNEPPSLEKGIVNIFVGLGFLIAAIAVMAKFPGGIFWGWAFFFPAFGHLGKGVAMIVGAKRQATLPPSYDRPEVSRTTLLPSQLPTHSDAVSPRKTGELVAPPPSVTEGTTRHLGGETATRRFDSPNEIQK
jgi:hypothetical protein